MVRRPVLVRRLQAGTAPRAVPAFPRRTGAPASHWCAGLQAGTAFPLWYIANTVPFRDIVGHRGVTTRIARAIARDTFPPSVILTGPEGVGKRLAAMATAEATNCAEPRTDDAGFAIDACGACSVCRRIGRAVFPDVVVVEPPDSASGAITIDQVRDVVEQVAYRPFEGRRRVVVIDEADLMAAQAQNALLKTLEEPPSASQFILVTARPDVLLDTVRSRCPRLRFGLLADDEIAGVLIDRHNIEPRLARASAASSGGSLGRALRSAAGELAVSRDAAVGLLESVAAARDTRGRLEGAKAFSAGSGARRAPAAARAEVRRRLRALATLLRDIEAVAAGADAPLANTDLQPQLRALTTAYGGKRGLRSFRAVDEGIDALDRNVSPKTVADWVACHL